MAQVLDRAFSIVLNCHADFTPHAVEKQRQQRSHFHVPLYVNAPHYFQSDSHFQIAIDKLGYITRQFLRYHLAPTKINLYGKSQHRIHYPPSYSTSLVVIRAISFPTDSMADDILRMKTNQLLLALGDVAQFKNQLEWKYLDWKNCETTLCYEVELSCTESTWNIVGRKMIGPDTNGLWTRMLPSDFEDIQLASVYVDSSVPKFYREFFPEENYKRIVLHAVKDSLDSGKKLFMGTQKSRIIESGTIRCRCTKYMVGLYYDKVNGGRTLLKSLNAVFIYQ